MLWEQELFRRAFYYSQELSCKGCPRGIRYMLKNGTQTQEQLDDALFICARSGYPHAAQLLVEQGADIHAKDDNTLCAAAAQGKLRVLQYLLQAGMKLGVPFSREGIEEAFWLAAARGQLTIVQYLIQRGVNVNAEGGSSLCAAASNGYLGIVRCLVEAGAGRDPERNSHAAEQAAQNGHRDVAKYLLQW